MDRIGLKPGELDLPIEPTIARIGAGQGLKKCPKWKFFCPKMGYAVCRIELR